MSRRFSFSLTTNAYVEIEEARFQINQLTAQEVDEVCVDLARVTLLDSMLLGQLVRLCLALKAKGIVMRLENVTFYGRTVIHHANLDSMFGLPSPEPPRWETTMTSM